MNNSIYRSLIGLVFWSFTVAASNALVPSAIYCEMPKGFANGPEFISAWFVWMCANQYKVALIGAITCAAALMPLIFRTKMQKIEQ